LWRAVFDVGTPKPQASHDHSQRSKDGIGTPRAITDQAGGNANGLLRKSIHTPGIQNRKQSALLMIVSFVDLVLK
jgi:hypothetical protein